MKVNLLELKMEKNFHVAALHLVDNVLYSTPLFRFNVIFNSLRCYNCSMLYLFNPTSGIPYTISFGKFSLYSVSMRQMYNSVCQCWNLRQCQVNLLVCCTLWKSEANSKKIYSRNQATFIAKVMTFKVMHY
jgi:hypothetical protein